MLGDISHKFGDTKSYYIRKETVLERCYIFEDFCLLSCQILSSSIKPLTWQPLQGHRPRAQGQTYAKQIKVSSTFCEGVRQHTLIYNS